MIKRVKHMYVYAIFIDNLHVGVNVRTSSLSLCLCLTLCLSSSFSLPSFLPPSFPLSYCVYKSEILYMHMLSSRELVIIIFVPYNT